MSDVAQTAPETSATPTAPTTEPALTNSPEARTADGTIKDQSLSSEAPPTKPEGEAKPEGEGKTEAPVVPEKYEFKAPEGIEIDPKVIEAVTPIFKELGLTQDQAQKLVDFQTARDKEMSEAGQRAFNELNTEWRKTVIADKEIGNGKDGLAPAVSKAVSDAINTMPNADAFRHILDVTGIGNNPDFIKGLYAIAKNLGEGKHINGANPSPAGQRAPGTARSAAQALYPNLPSAT